MTYYFNSAEILAPFSITSNEPTFDVDTVSLKKQRATQDAQRWELSFNTIGTPDTQADLLVNSVNNLISTATMPMPQLPSINTKYTLLSNSTAIAASAALGATSITINTANAVGLLPKGSFVKFSNHDKIYLVTADCNMNTVTNPTLSIFPGLTTALTTSHLLNSGPAAILTYYQSIDNYRGITFSDGVLSNAGTITLIEAI